MLPLCYVAPKSLTFLSPLVALLETDTVQPQGGGGRFDIAHLPLNNIEIRTHACGTRSSQAVAHSSTILAQMLQNFCVWISTGVLNKVRPLAGVKLTFPLHFFFTKHSSNCNKSLIGVECWKKAHGEKIQPRESCCYIFNCPSKTDGHNIWWTHTSDVIERLRQNCFQ